MKIKTVSNVSTLFKLKSEEGRYKAIMIHIFMWVTFFSLQVFASSSYFGQQCPLGSDERLIFKEDVVFYYQVENEAKLDQILVMVFQLDVIQDSKIINRIKLFNGYEDRPFRRGEVILFPPSFISLEFNKRIFVLSNCEVVPLRMDSDDELL